jgi:hypothetical protein
MNARCFAVVKDEAVNVKHSTKNPMVEARDEQYQLRRLALEIVVMLPRSPKKARRVVDLVNEFLAARPIAPSRRVRTARSL